MRSAATRRQLVRADYAASASGLAEAMLAGSVAVVAPTCPDGLARGRDGYAHWRDQGSACIVCFPVNHLGSTLTALTAARSDGSHIVVNLCSDGGGIPRNVTLRMGLTLVE